MIPQITIFAVNGAKTNDVFLLREILKNDYDEIQSVNETTSDVIYNYYPKVATLETKQRKFEIQTIEDSRSPLAVQIIQVDDIRTGRTYYAIKAEYENIFITGKELKDTGVSSTPNIKRAQLFLSPEYAFAYAEEHFTNVKPI